MKTLLLARHGKSSWEYSVSDKDRPLKERGINDALLVSTKLRDRNLKIDAVFSSPANRALHTCMIFLRQLEFPFSGLEIIENLYDFSGESDLNFIKSLDNSLDVVLIFGHNHAFTQLANSLGNIYIENVPTSGLVYLKFDVGKWEAIDQGTTVETIFPKELK